MSDLLQLPFVARPIDQCPIKEVWKDQEYGFVNNLNIRPRPSIIDLGANIGMFSLYCFSVYPLAPIMSFEPCLDTYKVLEENRRIFDKPTWSTYCVGLWSVDCSIPFAHATASSGNHISFNESSSETIKVISFETLIGEYIHDKKVDIMKVDIEGAEGPFLYKKSHLLTSVDHLIIEIHPYRCNSTQVISSLNEAYEFIHSIPGRISSKPLLLASHQHYQLPLFKDISSR